VDIPTKNPWDEERRARGVEGFVVMTVESASENLIS